MSPTILLAEDDALLADALVAQLGQAGFTVEHAPNGAVAEYLLGRQVFDLAILDIGLPMVDGLQVLRNARERRPGLPVMLLTALDALDDRVAGLNAGADDYLTKPFDFPELEARLRALLRRSRVVPEGDASAPASLAGGSPGRHRAAGRVEFDASTRRIAVDGETTDLSPRENSLLELLMSHPQQVVRKEHIHATWAEDGGESPQAPGMIEVYIHRLRRKLEGSGLAIRTVRGLGYLLEPAAAPAASETPRGPAALSA